MLQSPPLGFQDAMDEALIAVEQVVIPRHQPIELLPRTPELLDMQVSITQVSLHADDNCCCILCQHPVMLFSQLAVCA